ncbi:GTP-binding protein [Psychromonas sp. MME2]|uniref:GTP-binding protein n=1 Tax=unclassified Psychromonas TaxID=2614957 RepID=UPI00339C00E6
MVKKINCHIVSGFLGAGKSKLIERLISYKPMHENWAVLVNEIGHHQYAQAHALANNVVVKEIYGGCLCCSAGMPFRVALNNLIKESAPQRIFIEPAGFGHLVNIKKLLQGQFYQPILSIEKTICLLSEEQLSDEKYRLHDGYLSLIKESDKLWVNSEKAYSLAKKMAEQYARPIYLLQQNRQDLTALISDQDDIRRPNSSPSSIICANSSTKPSLFNAI